MLYSEQSHPVIFASFCDCGTELVSEAEKKQELCDQCADSPLGIEVTEAGRYLHDLKAELFRQYRSMRGTLEALKAGPGMCGFLQHYRKETEKLAVTLCTINEVLFRQQILSPEQD